MRKPLFLLVCVAFSLCVSGVIAGPRNHDRPLRFGNLDTDLVQVRNPADGSVWAAWGYRSGAETDVAVAVAGTDGIWTEPLLIGSDDGRSQTAPALAIGGDGAVHLVYSEPSAGRILYRRLDPVSGEWSAAEIVVNQGGADAPRVMVVGDRVVVAFRVGGAVDLVELAPTESPVFGTNGVQDGPDPFGNKQDGPSHDNEDDEPPVNHGESGPHPGDLIDLTTGSGQSGSR